MKTTINFVISFFILISQNLFSQSTISGFGVGNTRPIFPPSFLGWNNLGVSGPLDVRNDFNDNINFFTATAQRMIIRGQAGFNQGFVGIGNGFTTPQSLLHIHDGGLSYLHVTNTASGNGALQGNIAYTQTVIGKFKQYIGSRQADHQK